MVLSVSVMAQQQIQLRSMDKAECVKSDMAGLKASFSFSTLEAQDYESERGTFSWLSLPNTVIGGNEGDPQIPVVNQLIAVPFGAQPRIEITSYSSTDYRLEDYGIHTLVPRQPSLRKDKRPDEVPFIMNESAYQSTRGFRSEPMAVVNVEGIMRGVQIGTMTIEPVSYDPVNNTLRVFNDIEVTVHFDGADVQATEDMLLRTYSPHFNSVYAQLFNNRAITDVYDQHPDIYHTPVKMLVICYSGFKNNSALNSWLEWKLQKGYYVDIFYTDETGTTASNIASFIKTKYNASVSAGNAYTYLIVIGDTGQVPQYMTKSVTYSCASDLGYSSVNFSSNTNNYFPDMYYSRMSVENTTHLTNYINKVLTYEKYEFTDGGNYLNNVLLVGGWDSNWTSKVAKPTINYGANNYFNTSNTTYGGFGSGTIHAVVSTSSSQGYSGTNHGVYNGINDGACIVNYTAHGSMQEWQVPQFTAAQVATLTNTGKYFFGIGNCCLTGNFNNTSTDYSPGSAIGTNACFAETMIRVPNAGAVVYIGSSPYSYWYEDFYWAVGAHSYSAGNAPSVSGSSTGVYDAMFIDGNWNSASALLYLGNLAVQQAVTNGNTNSGVTDGDCKNSAHYYFQFYHTFGDGSVMPYITKPETNTVTIPSTVTPGTTSITVNALAGSYVAVTDNSSVIYGVAEANSSGVATVTFTNAIPNSGTLYVVVTRQQYQPYFGTITVQGGTQYTISANANPTNGGTVAGAGQYYENTECTLTATANAHYEFYRWTKNGTQVSTANPYTFTVTGNATYVANFNALSPHTVTCATVQNGTISASPTTAYKNETVTLTATPASGYYLGQWTVTAGNQNITVTDNQFTMPDSDVTVSATFVPGYTVTLAPATNGTISANPTNCPAGTTVNLTATPASGYAFDSWVVYKTDDVNTSVTVNGNSFTMPAYDVTVVGIFTASTNGDVTIGSGTSTSQYLPTYVWFNYSLSQQIYTAAEVNGAGTITAVSFYWYGKSGSNTSSGARNLKIYMSHTTNSDLSSAWIQESNNHLVYSGTQTFNTVGWHTITLDTPFAYDGTSNLLLTVDDNTGSYTVSAKHYFRTYTTGVERARTYCSDSDNPDPTGTVSSEYSNSSSLYNLTLEYNAQIKLAKEVASSGGYISASPTSLSGFTYPEGQGPSDAQTVTVIGRNLQSNMTVTAPTHYEVSSNGTTYNNTLTLTASNGSVQTTVYVRLKDGLALGNYNNETLAFTSGGTTQNVTLNGTVTEGTGNYYNITVAADPETGGTVTGGGRYEEGTNITLTATPASGYTFVNWTKNGTQVSTSPSFSFAVMGAGDYVAHFNRISYMIQASANPVEGGTVTGAGSYYEGTPVNLVATANTGYIFVNWTKNGTVVSTEPSYTFNATTGGSYVANFEAVEMHNITLNQVEGGTIGASVTTAYPGDVVTLTVNTESGYYFVEWDVRDADNQPVVVTNNQFTMPNSDVTVTAVLSQGFEVTLTQTEHGTISADHTTALQPGDIVTLTATPDTDCVLLSWYVFKTGDPRAVIAVVNDSYFVMPASDVTVMAVFVTTEEHEAQLGSGTSTNNYIPTYVRASYSLTQQIYLASELDNKKGYITKIAYRATTAEATRNLTIYMAHTDKSSFSSNSNWEVMGSVSKVFEGNVAFSSSDWTTITLDTPFEFDGESNLNICVVDNTGSTSGSYSSYTKFYRYSATNRALYVYGSSSYASTVGYTSLSSTTGTRISYVNQIKVTMSIPGAAESLTLSPGEMDDFSYAEGQGPSDAYKLDVVGVDLSNNITVTAPTNFEVSLTEDGTYTSSVTIPYEANKGRNVTTWGFEGSLDGWTALDADGDGYNWVLGSQSIGVYLNDNDVMTEGHDSSADMMVSGSWTNVSRGSALNPDNWLVSPQVTLGGTFSLWAQPYRANYPAEHFGIFVSTTDANPSSFTMINEWTLSASTWKEFSVDLSAYAGQTGYIAVRHFGMENNDQFLIKVDDFVLDTDATITIEMPVTITPATVYVRMKNNLNAGNYSGILAGNSGSITANVRLSGTVIQMPTQTVELAQGWNWWSANIGITLTGLESAIGANGISIVAQGGGSVDYNAAYDAWDGDFTELDLAKMYEINMAETIELALNGAALDPTQVPVTLQPNWNWIGYPLQGSMNLSDALSGFTPVLGDIIKSKESGFSLYNGSSWSGGLNTLMPGQGYMYYSNATAAVTFTYPANRGGSAKSNVDVEGNHWTPVSSRFAGNMTVLAVVELDGKEAAEESLEVGAFVGDECRGSVRLMREEATGRYMAFVTVHGENGESVSFKVLDGDVEREVRETMVFSINGMLGGLETPFVLHASGASLALFPNPVQRGETVSLDMPTGSMLDGARVEVYDALGSLVRNETLNGVAELGGMPTAGVYTVKVTERNGYVHFAKLVVR